MFEDEYYDIVRKARRGSDLSAAEAARASGLTTAEYSALEETGGKPGEAHLLLAAPVLGLDPDKLANLAFRPVPTILPDNPVPGARFATGCGSGSNWFVVGNSSSGKGYIVDPGGEVEAIVAAVGRLGLHPAGILVTHAHGDHTGGIAELASRFQVPVFAHRFDAAEIGGTVIAAPDGHRFPAGTFEGILRHLPGHTPGGAGFAFPGVVFTGDSLFARSVGGPQATGDGYRAYLASVRTKVLGLPGGTVVAPGHGPLSTVADELKYNPFFP